ncbi:MAG: zinc-ribbon domain-containing protein [Oscillospiraceae bacterium]|nr:zinc-ribbon domain-containing protein [Oscillospiraceae bacterium]
MFCTNCGTSIAPGARQCPACGAPVENTQNFSQSYTDPRPYAQQPVVNNVFLSADSLPAQYRPIGAWGYFGYMLLFSIPVIGFILLIVFSFSDANINRRNFARSYWCVFLLAIIITIVLAVTGGLAALAQQF